MKVQTTTCDCCGESTTEEFPAPLEEITSGSSFAFWKVRIDHQESPWGDYRVLHEAESKDLCTDCMAACLKWIHENTKRGGK